MIDLLASTIGSRLHWEVVTGRNPSNCFGRFPRGKLRNCARTEVGERRTSLEQVGGGVFGTLKRRS